MLMKGEKMSGSMSKDSKKILWLCIGILIMALGYVLPPTGQMTAMGWRVATLLIGVIVIVSGHGDMLMASFIACVDLVCTGYMTGTAAMGKLLGSSAIVQMLIMVSFAYLVKKSGATDVLGKKIMAVKFVQGKPILFIFTFMFACGIVAIFVGAINAAPIYYAIWEGTRDSMDQKADTKFNRLMLTGVCMSMCVGSTMLPQKGAFAALIAFFEKIVESYGYQFDFTLHLILNFIVLVVWCLVFALAVKFIFKIDLSFIKGFDINNVESMSKENRTFKRNQIVVSLAFLIALAYSVAGTFIPAGPFQTKWKSISLCVVAMGMMALLAIFKDPSTGKPYANLSEAMTKGISWGPYMVAFVLMLVSGALSDETLGIAGSLRSILGFMSSFSWPVFCLVALAITHLLTNFFSNSGTFMVMSAVIAPLAIPYLQQGINISTMLSGMIILDLAAFWTVSGQPAAAWLFEREGMSTGWVMKNGPILSALLVIICALVGAIAGPIA